MKGNEFNELAAFMEVTRERSFRRAARKLGVAPSSLSHTIRTLEERVGARLLNRTTRSVAPTEAGQILFDRLGPSLVDIASAVHDVRASQLAPRGRLRLNLPRLAARMLLGPRLAEFTRRFPEIRLDLVIDDSITDIVGRGFDAGIRSGALVHKDMVAVRLMPDIRMSVVGTPSYFEEHGRPRAPAKLSEHRCIAYRWGDTGALQRWSFTDMEVEIEPVFAANETDLLLTAALQGVGLAWLPDAFVEAHLSRGALVRVLDRWCKPISGLHLYYPHRPHMPAALRALVDFLGPAGRK